MNPETLTAETLKLGFAGVVIIALTIAVVWLVRTVLIRDDRATHRYDEQGRALSTLQEKRHTELIEVFAQVAETIDRNTEVFVRQAEGFRYLSDSIQQKRKL